MRIDRYEVTRELARGGMGAVFLAYDPQLGREVAIKVLIAGPRATDYQLRRFAREARALSRLGHPGIVPIHAAGEHEGNPYLVMEAIHGESLEERLQRDGPVPERDAAALCLELAKALAFAHAQGFLHRDLKPANVLVDRDGRVLLTDFGLAKDLDPAASASLSTSGGIMGTPGYWPPEQAGGRLSEVGPGSDVYGLGATLYALLTGRPPHLGASLIEFLALSDRDPQPPSAHRPGLDRRLEAICMRCLARRPSDRYAAAADLVQALEAFVTNPTLPARRWVLPVLLAACGLASVAVGTEGVLLLRATQELESRRALANENARLEERLAESKRRLGREAAPSWAARAAGFAERADWAGALASQGLALQDDPSDVHQWVGRSGMRLQLEDPAGALADADHALSLDPASVGAHWGRAAVLLATRRWEEAKGVLDRLAALRPDDDKVYFNRAMARTYTKDLDGALADSDRAIELQPEHAPYLFSRATIRGRLGDHRGAADDASRGLAIDPNDPAGLYHRARAYSALGELRLAKSDLSRMRALLPDDDPRTNAIDGLLAPVGAR